MYLKDFVFHESASPVNYTHDSYIVILSIEKSIHST